MTEQCTREDVSGCEGNQAQEGKYQSRRLNIFLFLQINLSPISIEMSSKLIWQQREN